MNSLSHSLYLPLHLCILLNLDKMNNTSFDVWQTRIYETFLELVKINLQDFSFQHINFII